MVNGQDVATGPADTLEAPITAVLPAWPGRSKRGRRPADDSHLCEVVSVMLVVRRRWAVLVLLIGLGPEVLAAAIEAHFG